MPQLNFGQILEFFYSNSVYFQKYFFSPQKRDISFRAVNFFIWFFSMFFLLVENGWSSVAAAAAWHDIFFFFSLILLSFLMVEMVDHQMQEQLTEVEMTWPLHRSQKCFFFIFFRLIFLLFYLVSLFYLLDFLLVEAGWSADRSWDDLISAQKPKVHQTKPKRNTLSNKWDICFWGNGKILSKGNKPNHQRLLWTLWLHIYKKTVKCVHKA